VPAAGAAPAGGYYYRPAYRSQFECMTDDGCGRSQPVQTTMS
jgi:hypothetical protein